MYDDTAGGFSDAQAQVFGQYPPLNLIDDDFRGCEQQERHWIERFLEAANKPYAGDEILDGKPDEQQDKSFQDQQVVLNQKPHQKPGGMWYRDFWVTRRFVLLFHAILNMHRGGPRPYAQGGDNAGYGNVDKQLICSKRLEKVESILSYDKRTVINVIEGRGVCAFAENPDHFAKRKVQNKNSNNMKKQQIDKGKGALAEVAESVVTEDDTEIEVDEDEFVSLRQELLEGARQGQPGQPSDDNISRLADKHFPESSTWSKAGPDTKGGQQARPQPNLRKRKVLNETGTVKSHPGKSRHRATRQSSQPGDDMNQAKGSSASNAHTESEEAASGVCLDPALTHVTAEHGQQLHADDQAAMSALLQGWNESNAAESTARDMPGTKSEASKSRS